MNEWFTTRQGLWEKAWERLSLASHARGSERFITLATIGLTGGPETRLVVLRGTDKSTGTLVVHTDSTSTKTREIAANPAAAIHYWAPQLDLQIRLRGQITVTTGETLRDTWNTLPQASFATYGVTPRPGTKIPAADAYDLTPKFEQFAQLTFTLTQADIVHLSQDFHRRAQYDRADNWTGHWLAP